MVDQQGFFLLFLPQNFFLRVYKIWIPNWAPDPKIQEKEEKRNFMFLKDGGFLKTTFKFLEITTWVCILIWIVHLT
jgi:hypothetical protein